MGVELSADQLNAIDKMKNGCILCGGVGSGKSRTAIGYYFFRVCQGDIRLNGEGTYIPMKYPRDLYIITTAKKRDTFEWDSECAAFIITADRNDSPDRVRVVIDSWNNIKKYEKVAGAFFVFDEQRVVGSGAWVKAFLNISRKNKWVLLSATPGDQWKDYIPVFVANGFYKNKTEFNRTHCVYDQYAKYPKINKYIGEDVLEYHRNSILVMLNDQRITKRHYIDVKVGYDKDLFKTVMKDRWDPYNDEPIQEVGKLYYLLRKVVNSSKERIDALYDILALPFAPEGTDKRYIIFYNFNYELELLRALCKELGYTYSEWNGANHLPIPDTDQWVYLVQYSAGCEGWNCIETNCIIFFSQSYSYRMTEQAAGRIDRLNTPYKELYYYRLFSTAWIDLAIRSALRSKRDFNEKSVNAWNFRTLEEE